MKKLSLLLLIPIAVLFSTLIFQNQPEKLVIFHAGSLSIPIAEIAGEFEKSHHLEVHRESSGSLEAIRKVTELDKRADLIAVSDYSLIEKMLMPEHADFVILFAKNEIVLAFTEKSRHSAEINSSNWFEVLKRNDVRFGFSDPNSDPCGYRALLTLKLADSYYRKEIFEELIEANTNIRYEKAIIVPERIRTTDKIVLRAKEVDLSALLETGAVDYIFTYKSVAKQHNLSYLELPPEINLGDLEKADLYAQISVVVRNETVKGEPIVYGVTALRSAKEIAYEFLRFMLSEKGREAFERNHHETMSPKLIGTFPEELRGVLE